MIRGSRPKVGIVPLRPSGRAGSVPIMPRPDVVFAATTSQSGGAAQRALTPSTSQRAPTSSTSQHAHARSMSPLADWDLPMTGPLSPIPASPILASPRLSDTHAITTPTSNAAAASSSSSHTHTTATPTSKVAASSSSGHTHITATPTSRAAASSSSGHTHTTATPTSKSAASSSSHTHATTTPTSIGPTSSSSNHTRQPLPASPATPSPVNARARAGGFLSPRHPYARPSHRRTPARSPPTPAGSSAPSNSPIDWAAGLENQALKSLVKEVMDQLQADVSVTSTPKGRRASTRTQNQQSIHRQKLKMPKEHDLAWKEVVRIRWKTVFQVSSVADFAEYDPAPTAAVADFETGKEGPDSHNVLDFGGSFERSRWNRVIIKRLVDDLLEEREEDGTWNICDVSNDYITALFYGQLKRSRETWKKVQKRPNMEEGRLETGQEVLQRVEEQHQENVRNVFRVFHVSTEMQKTRKTQRQHVFGNPGTCLPETSSFSAKTYSVFRETVFYVFALGDQRLWDLFPPHTTTVGSRIVQCTK
ncbi:hypothetical protein CPC08DRAFT_716377 [Agrocybe pediades]|nr:hypothetical protein CPC08DRAFT_716377 [Agrocybe pediades]